MVCKYLKFNAYQILSPAFERHDDRQHFTLSSTIITLHHSTSCWRTQLGATNYHCLAVLIQLQLQSNLHHKQHVSSFLHKILKGTEQKLETFSEHQTQFTKVYPNQTWYLSLSKLSKVLQTLQSSLQITYNSCTVLKITKLHSLN